MRWIGGGLDKRNLELRRQGWYAVKDVPAKLVPLVGRRRLRVTLQTRDHAVALLRRAVAMAGLEQRIAKAAGTRDTSEWLDRAMEARETLGDPGVVAVFREETVEQLTQSARMHGYPDPAMFAKVALGEATPIKPLVAA